MKVLVAHESDTIREVIRRLLDGVGWQVDAVSTGRAAVDALDPAPAALVLDVAIGELLAFEVRRRNLDTRVVLIASIYNRTGYKRKPTSLYGADDYVEQHHIPDSLIGKLAKLIGPPPRPVRVPAAHTETQEGKRIRSAGEERFDPIVDHPSQPIVVAPELVQRAERLARLIVADIALYNGDALDHAERTGDTAELDARLRLDLEEGRLLFELRVPLDVRQLRDFIGEALDELRHNRKHAGAKT